ncbi:hypothetical protein ACP4OV_012405 [Aristida adscensionis]
MGTLDRVALCVSLLCLAIVRAQSAADVPVITAGTDDGMERWGYVQVLPKAHLFWWYYKSPQRTSTPGNPWPTVLWLQGGPGSSGIGAGNFMEVGPLDVNLQPRNSTWLHKADLIFVDNPVGVGYSYVEDDSLLVTTDWQAAADMMAVLKALVEEVPTLQNNPLFLVAESYGGKYAATLGLSIARAIIAGEIDIKLGGIALGDSFISPLDFTLSYAPLLRHISRLDDAGANEVNKKAQTVKELMAAGNFTGAQRAWSSVLSSMDANSSTVDVYNFMLDGRLDPVVHPPNSSATGPRHLTAYSAVGRSKTVIEDILNGVIKEMLKVVPKGIVWQEVNYTVYGALIGEIMKPRIKEIDELLALGVNVTVYNGQLDVVCSTMGAEAWVRRLKWGGLKKFLSEPRQPLYSGPNNATQAFVRSYKNLHFYWILGAGHFVPIDQPCIAVSMIGNITQPPAP